MRLKAKKRILLYFIILVVFSSFRTFSENKSLNTNEKTFYSDSITYPEYIKRLLAYSKIYPFIRYNQNYIEWNDYSSVNEVFNKIKQVKTRKLKVLHIGDSHVQADIFTGYVRNEMQNIFGEGGRGFVFPYAAAETHAAFDYKTSCQGKWDYSKNIQPLPSYDIGITGITIYTEDSSACFKLNFNNDALKNNYNVLKLYFKRSQESFDLKLKASGINAPLHIDCNAFNDKLYVEIKLPASSDTLEFFINKTDTVQKYFEFYGALIETNENNGILYNSVGINGAKLSSILKENLLLYQLSELKPDLVIIDIGLNDFYKEAFNSKQIEKDLSDIIDVIQRASSNASIILADAQDAYYRYWNEANCKKYASLMREVAFRKGCAFYDYYYVSGGQYSMLNWYKNKLARNDKVHLTNTGYILRGELFLNALLNSYYISLTNPKLKSLIALKEFPDTDNLNIQVKEKTFPEISDTNLTASAIQEQKQVWKTETYYYKVKQGDNLSIIAKKYGVSVTQLIKWNSLNGTNIMNGKILVIYKQNLTFINDISEENNSNISKSSAQLFQTQSKLNTNANKPPITPVSKETKKHTVVRGDNLWEISKKYGISVEQLKQLNNLKNNELKIGMVLIITKI